jgi:hypothetical protein
VSFIILKLQIYFILINIRRKRADKRAFRPQDLCSQVGFLNLLKASPGWHTCGMNAPALPSRYGNHRFPREIVSHAVCLYFRIHLSYRDVEELRFEH